MPHPLQSNSKTDIIRQSFIGLVLGLIAIGVISQFYHGPTSVKETIKFDSETITLFTSNNPETEQHGTSDDIDVTNNKLPESDTEFQANANLYPFFALHKSPLNTQQVQAVTNNAPRVSIVLNHVGLNRSLTALILEKIQQDVTIGISPYTRNHNEVVAQLESYGYETWFDLATITLGMKKDYGDLALSPVNNFERNIEILSQQLANKDKVTGVILPNQSLITETPKTWQDIVYDLFAQGYGILDNTQKITKPALFFYDERRAPYIKGDLNLSDNMTLEEFEAVLGAMKQTIQDQNNVIATIPVSTPAHLDILARWVDSLAEENITLLPLSAQAKL